MGDQNRNTFKYRIRRSGQHQADPSRVKSLADLLAKSSKGAAVGPIDDSFRASVEDIENYRRQALNRQ